MDNFFENGSLYSDDMDQLFYLNQLNDILQRISINITIQDSPPNSIVLQAFNPNFFILAAEYYDDATKWNYIAQANNTYLPVLEGLQTILIPPQPTNDSGGLMVI